MKGRFAEKFWTADDLGTYPVLALDGEKNPVDAPASNMGHLLASGILSPGQAAAVAGAGRWRLGPSCVSSWTRHRRCLGQDLPRWGSCPAPSLRMRSSHGTG